MSEEGKRRRRRREGGECGMGVKVMSALAYRGEKNCFVSVPRLTHSWDILPSKIIYDSENTPLMPAFN